MGVLFYSVDSEEAQLEHFVQFWAPHFKHDRDKWEGVQRRTRMINSMENKLHEERSRESLLFSLDKEDENNIIAAFLHSELAVLHVHGEEDKKVLI